ncbi:hypothetical protein [Streptomyces sp. NPDC046942]|uniref:hypothetical protein n=1 Tax=Streptomyces sp. NPDC046942 TaxID=3155137 RepID=UPI003401C02F
MHARNNPLPPVVLALRRGCCTRVKRDDGTVQFEVRGRHFKGVLNEDGNAIGEGEERADPWIVLEPVARAIGVVEELEAGEQLFTRTLYRCAKGTCMPRTGLSSNTALERIRAFTAWANQLATAHDRPHELIPPDPDGAVALRRFRHKLAWEISRLPPKHAVVLVILLDTFKDTSDRHRDTEWLLQRLMWLMPNAFFVISGRTRLEWAEPAMQGRLDYTGPTAWPGLAAQHGQPARATGQGGTRQHLIGGFSARDCNEYLARRLTTPAGQPLISPGIRTVITEHSHGLPLHLDLAVGRFLKIRRAGRTPEPADFDHTFPAPIARTLSDLRADERHVLRSASLLDAFDLDLATRAAGLTHQPAARRLTERPTISEDPYAIWPYHQHGAIRAALRTADDHDEDQWTPADWHQAAERALVALGLQWHNAGADTSAPSRTIAPLRSVVFIAVSTDGTET